MTSSQSAVDSRLNASFGKVLAVEVAAYAVLIVLALIPGVSYGDSDIPSVVSFAVVGSVAMIALLTVFSPFRDGVAGHVISVIVGLLSAVCATTMMLGKVIFPTDFTGDDSFWMQEGWIAGVGGLLIVLIVASFARQMVRKERSHLIRSLSHNVVEGIAMISSAGWCFLPSILPVDFGESAATTQYVSIPVWGCSVVVVVAVAVTFGVCSYLWNRDADPEPDANRPWIGRALLPVMLTGAVVGIASLATVML